MAPEMLDVFKTIIIFHFDIYYMQFIFVCSLVMCYSFMVVNILHNHLIILILVLKMENLPSIQLIVRDRVWSTVVWW